VWDKVMEAYAELSNLAALCRQLNSSMHMFCRWSVKEGADTLLQGCGDRDVYEPVEVTEAQLAKEGKTYENGCIRDVLPHSCQQRGNAGGLLGVSHRPTGTNTT
jgi:hypothetical protein